MLRNSEAFHLEDDHDDHPMNLHGRPLRRTAALATVIALIVGVGLAATRGAEASAPKRGAEARVMLGRFTFTSQSACPGGLSVNAVIYSDQQGWSLTAQPVHSGCTMRADVPMSFVGDWDPSGQVTCSFSTGKGCFRRSGAPGLMKVGAIAGSNQTSIVDVEYRQGVARLIGSGTLTSVEPYGEAPSPVTLAGVAEVTAPGCTRNAYKVPFVAVSDGGGTWTLHRPAAVGAFCAGATYGGPATLTGSWDPSAGGCLSSGVYRFCLGAMPDRGVTNGIEAAWCPGQECWNGEAWVARL